MDKLVARINSVSTPKGSFEYLKEIPVWDFLAYEFGSI